MGPGQALMQVELAGVVQQLLVFEVLLAPGVMLVVLIILRCCPRRNLAS